MPKDQNQSHQPNQANKNSPSPVISNPFQNQNQTNPQIFNLNNVTYPKAQSPIPGNNQNFNSNYISAINNIKMNYHINQPIKNTFNQQVFLKYLIQIKIFY